MLLRSRKIIFIPTRKCAGTSICEALRPFLDDEQDLELYNLGVMSNGGGFGEWDDSLFETHYVFSCVRDPWDKMVSNWLYSGYGEEIWGEGMPFVQFCRSVRDRAQPDNWVHHTRLQACDYLRGGYYDMIMRFENLQEDWRKVCEETGLGQVELPRLNVSDGAKSYRFMHDSETKEIVARLFACDIEFFGYEF